MEGRPLSGSKDGAESAIRLGGKERANDTLLCQERLYLWPRVHEPKEAWCLKTRQCCHKSLGTRITRHPAEAVLAGARNDI